MQLLEKVTNRTFICGIEFSFNSVAIPSAIEGWQLFYNTTFSNADFEKAYAGKSSFDFAEESFDSPSGTSYKQKLTFRFPVTDSKRAERIALFKKINYVKLKTTTGLDIIIGRNDYTQNTRPIVKVKSNEQIAEMTIETQSIFPSGFTPNPSAYGLPSIIPLTLI